MRRELLFGLVLFLLGLVAWALLRMPFHNPDNIPGIMPGLGLSPYNNLAGYLLFLMVQGIGWFLFFRFTRGATISEAPANQGAISKLQACGLLLLAGVAEMMRIPWGFGVLDSFHDGESIGIAMSWISGAKPGQDFVFLHGLLQDPLRSVFAFHLFGESIGAVRTLESLTLVVANILVALLIIIMFRDFRRSFFLILVWIAAQWMPWFDGFQWLLQNGFASGAPKWALQIQNAVQSVGVILVPRDIPVFIAILVLIGLERSALRGKGYWLVALLGFLPIATLLYGVDRSLYLIAVAMPAFLWLLFWRAEVCRWKVLLAGAAGVLAGGVLVVLASKGTALALLRLSFLEIPRFSEYLFNTPVKVWHPGLILALTLLVLALVRWIQILATDLKRFREQEFLSTMLVILAVVQFRSGIGRFDTGHLLNVYYFPALAAIWLWRSNIHFPAISARWMWILLCLFAMGGALAGRIPEKFPLNRPDAQYISNDYTKASDYLRAQISSGSRVVTLTNEAIWYYYLKQPCPIRFPEVWFAVLPGWEDQIIAQIRQDTSIRFILMKNDHWANRIDGIPNEQRLPGLFSYARTAFEPDRVIGSQEIWKRKE